MKEPGPPGSPAALRKRLRALGLGALLEDPSFAPAGCIALAPGKVRAFPPGASKLGGDPDLPEDRPWPLGRRRRPLSFLGQIRLSDLAGLPAASALPGKGRLWFFADTAGSEGGGRIECAVIHSVAKPSSLKRRKPPMDAKLGVPATDTFVELGLGLQASLSLPETPPPGLDEDAEEAYWNLIHPDAVVHKLLGHPNTIQGPIPGTGKGKPRNALLLQLDSDRRLDMSWGDGGRLYILIPEADLAKGDFTRCRCLTQCH